MMEHKIMLLLVRVNVFNSTHPTKRNFSIIICFMLFAEWLPILNRYKHKFMNNYMEIICFMIFAEALPHIVTILRLLFSTRIFTN